MSALTLNAEATELALARRLFRAADDRRHRWSPGTFEHDLAVRDAAARWHLLCVARDRVRRHLTERGR